MTKPARRLIEGKPVLVIIDAQKTAALPTLPQLIEAAHRRGVPVIFALPALAPAGPEWAMRPDDHWIRKRRHSVFFSTELPSLLQELGAQTLVLAGGTTDVCIHYSFVDAHQHDYFCRVVVDCVDGSSPEAHENALLAMEYLQTGARRELAEVIEAFADWGTHR
jgi:hypothetical protein